MQRQGAHKWNDRLKKGLQSLYKDLDANNTSEDDRYIKAAEAMVYTGIYPRHELVATRKILIQAIRCQKSPLWKTLKNKLGIFEDGSWLAPHNPSTSHSSFYPGVNQHKTGNDLNKMSIHDACAVSVTMGCEEMDQSQSVSDATCGHKTVRVTEEPEKGKRIMAPSEYTDDRISAGRVQTKEPAIPFSFNGFMDRVGQRASMSSPTDSDENVTMMQAFVRENQLLATSSTKSNENVTVDQTGSGDGKNNQTCEDNPELEMKEYYKCDLCTYISCKAKKTFQHMRDELHYSASKVVATNTYGNLVPKEIITVMVITHEPALYKNVVPLCPVCNSYFPNIYACCQHYVQVHGPSVERIYSLGKVRLESDIFIDFNNFKCNLCSYQASKLSKWNQHMQSHTQLDYQRPHKDEIMICFCPYCLVSPTNYNGCLSHIFSKHKKRTNSAIIIKVAYIKKSGTCYQMLPLKLEANAKPEDAVERDLSFLQAIKKVCKRRANKGLRKMLNNQIKDLKIIVK